MESRGTAEGRRTRRGTGELGAKWMRAGDTLLGTINKCRGVKRDPFRAILLLEIGGAAEVDEVEARGKVMPGRVCGVEREL